MEDEKKDISETQEIKRESVGEAVRKKLSTPRKKRATSSQMAARKAAKTRKLKQMIEKVKLELGKPVDFSQDESVGEYLGSAKKISGERTRRVPLGVPRARLAVNERKGYVRRWINDRDGRILRAQSAGYNFVRREDVQFIDADVCNTNNISKVVNSDGTKAFLMEISKEFYDEDQKEKNKIVDRTEEALRHGIDSHGAPGKDGRYIPREGIKIIN